MAHPTTRRCTALASFLALALLYGARAEALPFNFEMRELRPEINAAARDVYVCNTCTLEQYQAIVPPEGWEKAAPRVGLWSSATGGGPPDIPGVALTADFVPEIAGDEFEYVARVLGFQLLGFSGIGPFAIAQVQRSTLHVYDAGTLIHEMIDPDGARYVLITFDYALSQTNFDLEAADSLAALPMATGWTYQSRVLDEALVMDSEGQATVFVHGTIATYQRYSLPEPAAGWLLGLGLGALTLRRARATG